MTHLEPREALIKHLGRIAREIDIHTINTKADLRDECDIDSMDFLNLITALAQEFSCPMPESDYDQMRSFDDMLAYLNAHVS